MFLYEQLKSLRQARGKHATLLYVREAIGGNYSFTKLLNKLVRCGNSIRA
jgi:hypothetical protein